MLVQFLIHESRLDESLTVVEHAINLNCGDVLSKSGELTLLNRRDLTFGIKHIDVDSVNTEEAVCHSGARVTGSGYEDRNRGANPSPSPREGRFFWLGQHIAEKAGHEAGAYVLESEGRAMKQFEGIDVVLDFHYGRVELKRVIDNGTEVGRRHVFAKECVGNAISHFLKSQVLNCVEEVSRQVLNDFRHKQAAVWSEALDNCLAQCGAIGRIIGRIV